MKKIYKGWELLKAIENGEIKEGSKFKAEYETFIARDGYLFEEYDNRQKYANSYELKWEFELIEDEIDIDSIEEFEIVDCNIKFNDTLLPTENIINDMILDKMNKLVQAVKQIDKRVKKLEGK